MLKQESQLKTDKFTDYQRCADEIVDIDVRIRKLEAEITALKWRRRELEKPVIDFCIETGIMSDTIGELTLFLRRETEIEIYDHTAALEQVELAQIPEGIEYKLRETTSAAIADVAKKFPKLFEADVNKSAVREWIRKANLPGARERLLARIPAIAVEDVYRVRTRPKKEYYE